MAKIDSILEMLPKYYNKKSNSNLVKFLSSIANELDFLNSNIEKAENSKYIEYSTGEDLDKLGSLLNMTRFLNETDRSYRARIKSAVPSFIGGGTLNSIRQIVENFTDAEYFIHEHYKDGMAIYDKFINGVFNGLKIKNNNNILSIESGIAYIDGKKIEIDEQNLDMSSIPNGTNYIYLKDNSSIVIKTDNIFDYDTEIFLADFNYSSGNVSNLNDRRIILNPDNDFITKDGTISIELYLDKNSVDYDDFRYFITKAKAAGIAVLIKFLTIFMIFIYMHFNARANIKIKKYNKFRLSPDIFNSLSKIKLLAEFPFHGAYPHIGFINNSYLDGSSKLDGSLNLDGVNILGINLYNNNADKLIIRKYKNGELIYEYKEE